MANQDCGRLELARAKMDLATAKRSPHAVRYLGQATQGLPLRNDDKVRGVRFSSEARCCDFP
jgi:hypothetical protein